MTNFTFLTAIVYLKDLHLLNFKNYTEANIAFSSGVNCIVGKNGSGKTNLLDAVHYLSACKSYFNTIDSQNIKKEEGFFVVQGGFDTDAELGEEIYCGIKKGEKKIFKRNKKEYTRFSEHIGLIPIVMISPYDSELIYDGSEVRRKFVDAVISQYNRTYLETLINYNKILQQRNALLKNMGETGNYDKESLEVWDFQLANYGEIIYNERKLFIEKFVPIFATIFPSLISVNENAAINYISHLNSEHSFEDLLKSSYQRDAYLEHTSVGIHKDDFEFLLNDFSLKKFASQGQQKTFLLALKLAQFNLIKDVKQITPILLLDDIYDKLDEERAKNLMNLVAGKEFGQIFITDAHPTRLYKLFEDKAKEIRIFMVESGEIKELNPAKA
ncbi:MAG: DNA replication and repair protein RecF [Bacteroidota bacterium]